MLKIGLVGVRRGSIVQNLKLRDDIIFEAVCDIKFADPAKAEKFTTDWKQVGVEFAAAYDNFEQFLTHDLDIILISTPPRFHAEQSIKALNSGRHVLCEVPAVMNTQEAKELVAAVRKAKGKYFFLENCCDWAFVKSWQKMIDDNRLGQIFYLEGDYIHDIRELFTNDQGRKTWRWDFEPIRYITHETGPLLDMLHTRAVSVSAMASQIASPELYNQSNAAVAIVTTETGAIIKLLISFCNKAETYHQYRVFGTQGTLETRTTEDITKAVLTDIPHLKAPVQLPMGTVEPNLSAEKTQSHGSADWRMLDTIINAIIHDQPGGIDVYRALDYSLIGTAAAESIKNNAAPIRIPDPRTFYTEND